MSQTKEQNQNDTGVNSHIWIFKELSYAFKIPRKKKFQPGILYPAKLGEA